MAVADWVEMHASWDCNLIASVFLAVRIRPKTFLRLSRQLRCFDIGGKAQFPGMYPPPSARCWAFRLTANMPEVIIALRSSSEPAACMKAATALRFLWVNRSETRLKSLLGRHSSPQGILESVMFIMKWSGNG